MSFKFLALGLTLVASVNALAVNHGHFFHKQSLLMQSNSPEGAHLKLRADGTMRSEEVGFYNQKLDHRNPNSPIFKQRFFVDSKYASGPDAPVFLIICGEWNCGGTGSSSFVESMAKNMKGHLVSLEHRFYGESLPTANLTAQNLQHLSLEAALMDLATFQQDLMKTRGWTGKWIVTGGSYAGTLAAFYRLKFPTLAAGALASSAPVLMKNRFSEYDAHIASVINKTTCGDKVREAVKLIEDKLETPEGTNEVKTLFKATNVVNNKDFLYVVADMLAAAVQYGRDKVFCQALTSNSDLIQGYAKGGLAVLTSMGSTPFEISLAVAERENVTADDNMRQWMWQSCRQFGWFQVANGTGNGTSRSSQIDLAYHQEVCARLYKQPMTANESLNRSYYNQLFSPVMNNIIFTNGSNDPWLTLSVTERTTQRNPGFDLFMIQGAAHCDDLRLSMNNPAMMSAQAEIVKVVTEWLK
ncbi:S28 family serine protease [Peredibacter starrii]|uniref:S28 family serine protease n=1 Tax=Peredibacter starrii TaxID=28202 RepID=A0AAX4HJ28_9BACT|nr:S28 family serine protease [Peredibacter starrii]WPU63229.1 S28 family serine protease [Peredibacter starrii]